jgi:hypothetical protein
MQRSPHSGRKMRSSTDVISILSQWRLNYRVLESRAWTESTPGFVDSALHAQSASGRHVNLGWLNALSDGGRRVEVITVTPGRYPLCAMMRSWHIRERRKTDTDRADLAEVLLNDRSYAGIYGTNMG